MNGRRRGTLILSLALLAGCLGPPGTDDNLGAEQPGLTRAPYTGQDAWVVGLNAGGKGCSGSVLSAHWILTAAHCATVPASATLDVTLGELPSSPGAQPPLRHLYQGSAQYLPNPDWNPTCPLGVCIDTDADDDLGLIHLTGGGINLAFTGQAELFDDDEEPYHGHGDRGFHIVGYGLGTDPGGSSSCDDGTLRGKRLGSGFVVDVSGDDYQAHAPYGSTHPCPGDSGSPWLFSRGPAGGEVELIFGVMSSMRPDVPLIGPKMWAALVKPRRGWIEATSAGTAQPLRCDPYTVAGWRYRICHEPRIVVRPLPPVVADSLAP